MDAQQIVCVQFLPPSDMERKFVKSRKAQRAADLRVTANVSLQETRPQALPDVSMVQLIDYEAEVDKVSSSRLREHSDKELLLFPQKDFEVLTNFTLQLQRSILI